MPSATGTAVLSLLILALTTVLCATLVPVVRLLAFRLGIVDQPGHRKVHRAPTPRLGGLAVFASFTGVVLTGYLVAPELAAHPVLGGWFGQSLAMLREVRAVGAKLLAVLAGGAVVFVVGLLDDRLGGRFPVWVKLLGQVAAASVLPLAGVSISFLPFAWLNALVTVVWVVGITNAFNLLDNMDGASAGVALVASLVLLVNARFLGEHFVVLILAAFAGSLVGFLLFNLRPASVFLGDCGSLFIGFVMASVTLLERYVSHASSTLFPVLMPVVVLAVPLVDTATVVVIRLREGRPIYVGDNCHLAHQLVAIGFSPRCAVLLLHLLTLGLGLGAVFLPHASPAQSLLILLQALCFVAVILSLLFVRRRVGGGPA